MKKIFKSLITILFLPIFLSTQVFASTAQTIVWDANEQYKVNLGVGVFNNTEFSGGALRMPSSLGNVQWVTSSGADYVINRVGQRYFRASANTTWRLIISNNEKDVTIPISGNGVYVLRNDGTVYRDSSGVTISGISNADAIFAVRDSAVFDHIYYLTKGKRIRVCSVYYTGNSCTEQTITDLPEKDFIKISGSNSHVLALAADGTVYGWRHARSSTANSRTAPTSAYLGGGCTTTVKDTACLVRSGVSDIAAGWFTSYMLENGMIFVNTVKRPDADATAVPDVDNCISAYDSTPTSGYVSLTSSSRLTGVVKIGSLENRAGGVAITSSGELYQWGLHYLGSSLACSSYASLRAIGIPSNAVITKPSANYGPASSKPAFNPPLIVSSSQVLNSIGEAVSLPPETATGLAVYELNYSAGTTFSKITPVASSGVRYAFSTDGMTWKIWNGSSWANLTNLDALYTGGMTSITGITPSQWGLLQSGTTKIFIAVGLTSFTQAVSSITINKAKPIEILTLTCPSGYTIGNTLPASCSANVYIDPSLTTGVSLQWSISSGLLNSSSVSGITYSATFWPKLIGKTSKTETITLTVCGNSPNTNICETRTVNILLYPPSSYDLSPSTLSCPSTTYTGKNEQCIAKVMHRVCDWNYDDDSGGEWVCWNVDLHPMIAVAYTWTSSSSGFTVSPNNPNNTTNQDVATVKGTTSGTKTVKVKAAFRDAPDFFTEKTASIEVTSPPVTVTSMTCTPSSAYLGQQINCSGSVDNPGEYTLSNTWTIRNVDDSTGGAIISTGGTELAPTSVIKATTTQQSKIVRLKSCATQDSTNCGEKAFVITVLPNTLDATITGDTKLLYNEDGHVHLSSATKTWGTLQYSWSVSSGVTKTDISPIAPNVSSVRVKSTANPATVTARISLVEDPTFFITRTHNIEVVVPELSILSFSCPTEIDYSQTQQVSCSVNVHAKSTTNKALFTWTGNNVTFSGQTNTDTSSQINMTFPVGALSASAVAKACLSDVPTMCVSQNITVKINYPKPVLGDINCPNSFYVTQAEECNVSVSTSWGTSKNTWTSSGTITQIDNNRISVVFNTAPANGTGTVSVNSCLNEVPSICSSKTKNVSITTPVINISSLSCPESLAKRVQGECSIAATVTDNLPLSYSWFTTSDGVVSSDGNIASVKYESAGRKTMTVTVSVSNIPGIKTSMSKNIDVTGITRPTLEVSGNRTISKGQTFTLTGKGTSPFGDVKLSWTAEEVQHEGDTFRHSFLSAGLKYVTLKGVISGYEDDPDAEAKLNIRMTVNDVKRPYISSIFGLSKGGVVKAEVGVPYSLKATAIGEFPTVVRWELSDGTKAEGDEFTFTSSVVGELKGKATVVYRDFANIPELTSSVDFTIFVRAYELITPELKIFTPTTGVAPHYVAAIARGNFAEMYSFKDNTLTFKWDFGNGTVKEVSKPSVVENLYVMPGVYTLSLTLLDSKGNQKTVTENIEVLEPPPLVVDSFKVVKSNKFNREPLLVVLRPIISGGHPKADRITEYKWAVNGEAIEGSSKTKSLVLPVAGSYTISLDVSSATGRTASKSLVIDVLPNKPPVCDFVYTNYKLAKATKITPSCIDSDGSIQSYKWDLGNGETSTRTSPYVMYQSSGSYNVRMTAVDNSGAEVVVEKTVIVNY